MLTRRESRAIALQTLFYIDFKDIEKDEAYKYTLSDFFDAKEDDGRDIERVEKDIFSFNLVENILEKKELLDEIIKKAAPEWPLEKISLIDKNILRIGIYELLFDEEKKAAPIVINEAIILSKTFNNSEKSDNFIAGVLGSILEASGIDNDESRNKIKKEEKIKYGFLPYYIDSDKIKVALVYNIFGKWTLAKGSVKGKFSSEQEAILDIAKRKLNIKGKVEENIGSHSYSAGIINDKQVIKQINYFLLRISNPKEIKLDPKLQGLNKVQYFNLDDLDKIDTYEDVLPLFKKAKEILKK